MKKKLNFKPSNSGQALMVFFLIICLLTGSVCISVHLNKSGSGTSTAEITKQEPVKGGSAIKLLPNNRYYFEVLMY